MAWGFPDQVPYKVKEARFNAIMSLQQEISRRINSAYLGRTISVLIDERLENGLYCARSQHDAPEVDGNVFVRSARPLRPGDFVDAQITDTMEYDLSGECKQ